MLKKSMAIFLCAALAVISVMSVSAESGITGKNRTYTYVTKYTLQNQQIGFFTYNITDTTARMELRNLSTNQTTTFNFSDAINHPVYISMGAYTYEQRRGLGNGSSGGGGNLNFSNTGGKYEQIRIKLSDYINGFNENGTVTLGGHTYNFNRQVEGNTTYESSLIFESGGALTLAAPDKNGMVEIVVSAEIGREIHYSTDFRKITPTSSGSGGGTNRGNLHGLTYGDVDDNSRVNVSDATAIQQKLAYMLDFDAVQIRNGDIDKNGTLDVLDATLIQEYIAGIK